jgi:RNA polymerase sigma-70 factor (ECF subfamily)
MSAKRRSRLFLRAGEVRAMSPDDRSAHLVARARSGDRDALDALLESSRPDLVRRLRRYGLSLADAEDIVQEACALVPERIATFEWRGPASFAAWLKQLVRGKFADWRKHRRRARRDSRRRQELPASSGLADPHDDDRPSRVARRGERARALRAAMRAVLRPRERRAVELRYFEMLAVDETATEMGCSQQVVKNLCSRSLQKLKAFLGEPAQYLSSRWGWRKPQSMGETPDATPESLSDSGRDQGPGAEPAGPGREPTA